MYTIEVNGELFQYDGAIQMTVTSPIFSDSISHSLQSSMSVTPEIKRICGFINRPDVADNQTRELPCVIRDGILFYSGTITFQLQGGKINFYFKESGDFWSNVKDKLLSDIAWDKIALGALDYAGIVNYIESKLSTVIEESHTFPVVKIGENAPKSLPIKIAFNSINQLSPLPVNEKQTPIIPFFYLKYLYSQIFEKNGVFITESIFDRLKYLKRLVLPNNYLINEFSLNTTIENTQQNVITKITNSTDPVVTTIFPHSLLSGQFVFIKSTPGMAVDSRIFQIEVVDTVNFKLLGANFSTFTEFVRNSYTVSQVTKETYIPDANHYAALKVVYEGETPAIYNIFYMVSSDWSGYVIGIPAPQIDDEPASMYIFPSDPAYLTHQYNNITLLQNKSDKTVETISLPGTGLLSWKVTGTVEGEIQRMIGLENEFTEIDPANHVPSMKINDFLKELQETFGIIPFVKQNSVKIKSMKEILTSTSFIDISSYCEEITDIVNPAIAGYKLSFKADGNDTYFKTRLPVQSIDKYTLKPAVPSYSWLAYELVTGDTNDCRLVTAENAFYVYNKTFINTDSQWKFLCYNFLDDTGGSGTLSIDSAFSPVLSAPAESYLLTWEPCMDVAFTNKNFASELKMAPRLLYYHGVYVIAPDKTKAIASGDILPVYDPPLDNDFLIRWEGEKGILKNCLQEYLHWQLNVRKDCKCMIHWPKLLLQQFDGSDKYRIRGVDYLVAEIKPNITPNGLTFAQTDLVKV